MKIHTTIYMPIDHGDPPDRVQFEFTDAETQLIDAAQHLVLAIGLINVHAAGSEEEPLGLDVLATQADGQPYGDAYAAAITLLAAVLSANPKNRADSPAMNAARWIIDRMQSEDSQLTTVIEFYSVGIWELLSSTWEAPA